MKTIKNILNKEENKDKIKIIIYANGKISESYRTPSIHELENHVTILDLAYDLVRSRVIGIREHHILLDYPQEICAEVEYKNRMAECKIKIK